MEKCLVSIIWSPYGLYNLLAFPKGEQYSSTLFVRFPEDGKAARPGIQRKCELLGIENRLRWRQGRGLFVSGCWTVPELTHNPLKYLFEMVEKIQ
jgi:hypothetical protein